MNECLIDQSNNSGKISNPHIPRYESSYIVATLAKKQLLNNSLQLVKFDTAEEENGFFKLDVETNKIEVLKNCTGLLSGNIFVDGSGGDGYVWSHIRINSKDITSNLTRIINRDYVQCSVPVVIKKLNKGDIVDMSVDYATTGGNPSIRNSSDNTFLSIVKI